MARPTSIPSCALIAVICVGLFAQLLPVFLRSLGLHGTCPEIAVDLRGRRALVVGSSHEKGWSDTALGVAGERTHTAGRRRGALADGALPDHTLAAQE